MRKLTLLSVLGLVCLQYFLVLSWNNALAKDQPQNLYFIDAKNGKVIDQIVFTDLKLTHELYLGYTLDWLDVGNEAHYRKVYVQDYNDYIQACHPDTNVRKENDLTVQSILFVAPRELVFSKEYPDDSAQSLITVKNGSKVLFRFPGTIDETSYREFDWNLVWNITWTDEQGKYFLRLPPANHQLEITVSNATYWKEK